MAKAATTSEMIETLVPWITYRQLEFWCEKGYVRSTANGSGRARVIEPAEQRILVAMARLVRTGIGPELAARVARKAVEVAGHSTTAKVRISSRNNGDAGITIEMHGL